MQLRRASWLDALASASGEPRPLTRELRAALHQLDDALFELWNLGENVLLAWSTARRGLRVLPARHYAIAEAIHQGSGGTHDIDTASRAVNEILAGPTYLQNKEFERVCRLFGGTPRVLEVDFEVGADVSVGLVSRLIDRYGMTLVRGRAVVLLDAVGFSLRAPLEQVAMLGSLAYSVNSAYRQLLSRNINVNFARTTTGDGFYIWNRERSVEADIALYQLTMMILADNAVAQRKARGDWVPRLRAAFHVGEYYEFYQVEALNPTTFSYIVGPVTIDLSRMIDKALPGQILIGEFDLEVREHSTGRTVRYGTLEFFDQTAAALEPLRGLEIAGDRIERIRCYLTGERRDAGRFSVNRYHILDKHGASRRVYNAKINIHRERAEPIFLGVEHENLAPFSAMQVDVLDSPRR